MIMGCVDPVGEAGGDIARAAVLEGGLRPDRAGHADQPLLRLAASTRATSPRRQIMSGEHDLAIGGGVEAMSRVGIGASGGAWPVDPSIAIPAYFMPQGISADLIATKYGFSRDDVDAYAVESQKRAANAWSKGYFENSVVPIKDVERPDHPRPRRAHAARHHDAVAGLAQARLRRVGRARRFRRRRDPGASARWKRQARPHAGNSSGIVDGAAAVLIGTKRSGQGAGLEAAGADQGVRQDRLGTGADADRPVDVARKVLKRAKHEAQATST